MKDSELYKKAAEIVANREGDEDWFACLAISKAFGSSYLLEPLEFTYWFKPRNSDTAWFTTNMKNDHTSEHGRMVRSIALLFMAEIAEDAEKAKELLNG